MDRSIVTVRPVRRPFVERMPDGSFRLDFDDGGTVAVVLSEDQRRELVTQAVLAAAWSEDTIEASIATSRLRVAPDALERELSAVRVRVFTAAAADGDEVDDIG